MSAKDSTRKFQQKRVKFKDINSLLNLTVNVFEFSREFIFFEEQLYVWYGKVLSEIQGRGR